MPRVSVTTQKVVRTGLAPSLTAPTVDNDIIDTGSVFLWVNNGGAGSINVTVQTPVTVDDLALADLVVAVPAGAQRLIGPFPVRTFGQTVTDVGRAYVDYSGITSVTRAVVSF